MKKLKMHVPRVYTSQHCAKVIVSEILDIKGEDY